MEGLGGGGGGGGGGGLRAKHLLPCSVAAFKLDLYFMMLYQSKQFERNCCIPVKRY